MDFDHLVVLAKSPEKGQQDMKAKHGIRGVKGGHHKEWGTYNYLAFFENTAYIEWIGIEDYDRAKQSENPLIQQCVSSYDQQVEGPITFALRTNRIDQLIQSWKEDNLLFKGPFEGSREKPDGSMLTWRMLFPLSEDETPLPFLIEWGDEVHAPDHEKDLNVTSFQTIHVGVDRLDHALNKWTQFYQLGNPTESTDLAGNPSYEWELGNGRLSLSNGAGINAKFGDMNL